MLHRDPRSARQAWFAHLPARAIDAERCDLVVYPTSDEEAYVARTPALVAVHDLMHRYERQFSEYGAFYCEYRDRHFRAHSALAAGLLVDSKLGREQLVESYGTPRERVHVLPYACASLPERTPTTDARARHRLPERFFFYAAQFWEHKNHLRLLEATAAIRRRGVPATLVLCGSRKNSYDAVIRRIHDLGLGEHVRVLGYVPDDDVAALYREALATVYVSLIGPTNIPPLEAMAAGCPLIVSDVYAMPEQVGDAALVVNTRDVPALAAAMERVWTDAALRAELARRGRARASQWTEADFGRRLREIVRSVIAGLDAPRRP
jgi:glycosyltransferase involved in cell wall biosynthesis